MDKQVEKKYSACGYKMTKKAAQKMMKESKRLVPEAVDLQLKEMNDKIDLMGLQEVIEHLHVYSPTWPISRSLNTLRKNLKGIYKGLTFCTIRFSLSPNLLPYYVVIDFEATCEKYTPPNFRPEIIEFAAVIVKSETQVIIDCFQMYCKPQINPILSKYCQTLTGITQETVDSAETFDVVLNCFHSWLREHKIQNFGIVTDGPWDTARYLFNQCYNSNIPFPAWGRKWINLKTVFRYFYKGVFDDKIGKLNISLMQEYLGLKFNGRQHCGLDDAWNLARVLLVIIYNGASVQFNEKIKPLNNSWKDNQNHKKQNGDCFKHEFCTTKDRNIVRAQFTSERRHGHPLPTYSQCIRAKFKQQTLLAKKMFVPS